MLQKSGFLVLFVFLLAACQGADTRATETFEGDPPTPYPAPVESDIGPEVDPS